MFKNISLSLVGLIFVIMIAFVYFKKKKYNTVDSNVYRLLIFWTIFILILELSCSIIISYIEILPLLTEVLCRFYIFSAASWFILLIAYMRAFLEPEKYKETSDVFFNKSMLILIFISIVLFIISCFSELTYTSQNIYNYNVIGGDAVLVLYAVFGCACVLIFKVLSRNTDKMTLAKRLPIILYLFLFAVMKIFQSVYSDVSDLCFLFSFCVVSMYFTIENQDIKLVNELEIAKKNAEIANNDRTEFLSKMSHEIRTPMNAILGFSENLIKKDELNKEETIEDVNNIYNASKELLEIINNILFYSRVESGKEDVEEIEYKITDVISDLDIFINSRIKDIDISYIKNIDENMPLSYVGDKSKLHRLLVNLLDISLNNLKKGIIKLDVTYLKNDNDGILRFVIKDSGTGMKKEDIEKFSNELETNNNNLNILILKKVINMLDAKVLVESEYGIGTIITIEINQKVLGNEIVKDNIINLNNEINNLIFDCSNYNVLIVDDNELNIKVINKLLKPYNINIDSVNNGKDCIDRVKQGKKYDLIFLDHLMSNMNGIETMDILRKINLNKLPPVIMMSANDNNEFITLCLNSGFSDYLDKPVNSKKLNDIMIKYLKKDS